MPAGPRSADVIGSAVRIMQIATGEVEEDPLHAPPPPSWAAGAARTGPPS